MSLKYRVKTIVTTSGERLPILIGRDGLPMFEPTVFSLTEVRSRNRASNTIDSYLRSVMVLLLFLDLRKINLAERLKSGQLLSLGEVEDLVGICRLPLEKIHSLFDEVKVAPKPFTSSVVSLENVRKRPSVQKEERVDGNSAANRLRNIRDYLKWLCLSRISKLGIDASLRLLLESSMQNTSNAIEARMPTSFSHFGINHREGLVPESVNRILQVINPHSNENPWINEHAKYRNELIILWLLHTGMRRGELLNIRIPDLNFQKNTVVIARRADDSSDPRVNQPKVKTRGREIPLSTGLVEKTNAYIFNQRSKIRGARRHNFLFVSSVDGAPMSIPALNKLFNVLSNSLPALDEKIFPHIFRHTWNDRFSEEMDKNKVSEDDEKKARSFLMGWSETSGTAATYTRRHICKKAQAASLQLQNNLSESGSDV
ncbi:MAG TPA: site-specific integrase [Methylotenera sp.]|nr:site-specific integrase [Methylotenera sp.]